MVEFSPLLTFERPFFPAPGGIPMASSEVEEDPLSDWEKEIDEESGQVLFVGRRFSPERLVHEASSSVPYKGGAPEKSSSSSSSRSFGRPSKGLHLSRLVRRRESKRERVHASRKTSHGGQERPSSQMVQTDYEEEEEAFGSIQTFESLLEVPSESLVDSTLLDFSILETVNYMNTTLLSSLKYLHFLACFYLMMALKGGLANYGIQK